MLYILCVKLYIIFLRDIPYKFISLFWRMCYRRNISHLFTPGLAMLIFLNIINSLSRFLTPSEISPRAFLTCLVTSTKLLFTELVERWRKITKRFFSTFLPFFLQEGGIKN